MRARDTECIRVRTVSVFISSMMASVFADARTTDVRAACVGRATDFYDDEYATRVARSVSGYGSNRHRVILSRTRRARAPPASRRARAHGCLKISPTRVLARVTRACVARRARTAPRPSPARATKTLATSPPSGHRHPSSALSSPSRTTYVPWKPWWRTPGRRRRERRWRRS